MCRGGNIGRKHIRRRQDRQGRRHAARTVFRMRLAVGVVMQAKGGRRHHEQQRGRGQRRNAPRAMSHPTPQGLGLPIEIRLSSESLAHH